MNEDYIYLIGAYLVYLVTLVFLSKVSINFRRTFFINFWILIVYSVFILFNMTYLSAGGSALIWLVLLFTVIGIHWIINLFIAIKRYKYGQ